eukprot:scaffold237597_cov37-Tisochrysis_lutea.AAC.6
MRGRALRTSPRGRARRRVRPRSPCVAPRPSHRRAVPTPIVAFASAAPLQVACPPSARASPCAPLARRAAGLARAGRAVRRDAETPPPCLLVVRGGGGVKRQEPGPKRAEAPREAERQSPPRRRREKESADARRCSGQRGGSHCLVV